MPHCAMPRGCSWSIRADSARGDIFVAMSNFGSGSNCTPASKQGRIAILKAPSARRRLLKLQRAACARARARARARGELVLVDLASVPLGPCRATPSRKIPAALYWYAYCMLRNAGSCPPPPAWLVWVCPVYPRQEARVAQQAVASRDAPCRAKITELTSAGSRKHGRLPNHRRYRSQASEDLTKPTVLQYVDLAAGFPHEICEDLRSGAVYVSLRRQSHFSRNICCAP